MTGRDETEAMRLIALARDLVGEFDLGNGSSAGSVAAALVTAAGNTYTGICVDLACGIGFCAEHSAIAAMLARRERRIAAIVALNARRILPPCGRCRELIAQVSPDNFHCRVILSSGHAVPLAELLPRHWLGQAAG